MPAFAFSSGSPFSLNSRPGPSSPNLGPPIDHSLRTQAVDEQAVGEQVVDEQVVDEQEVDKQAVDEKAVDEQAVDEQDGDEHAVNQQAVDDTTFAPASSLGRRSSRSPSLHLSRGTPANWLDRPSSVKASMASGTSIFHFLLRLEDTVH